jgi:hypothetical protein
MISTVLYILTNQKTLIINSPYNLIAKILQCTYVLGLPSFSYFLNYKIRN